MNSVSLIIVNYNSESLVNDLLITLIDRPSELPDQLILVDNSPANGLADLVRAIDHSIEYYSSSHNRGFAGGVNLGLRYSKGRYIILLNPDTMPEKGCLSGLIQALTSEKKIAVAGPVLYSFDEEPQAVISATQTEPSLFSSLVEYTILQRFMPKDWLNRNYFVSPHKPNGLIECAMVQGACFAFKRKWLASVGDFDEEAFFLYWEETDFCRRIRKHGGKVVYCTQFACRHLGGASVQNGQQHIHHFWRSLFTYHRKHNGFFKMVILRFLLIPGIAAELLLLMFIALVRRKKNPQLIQDINRLRGIFLEQFR